jgi:hypothetical protein
MPGQIIQPVLSQSIYNTLNDTKVLFQSFFGVLIERVIYIHRSYLNVQHSITSFSFVPRPLNPPNPAFVLPTEEFGKVFYKPVFGILKFNALVIDLTLKQFEVGQSFMDLDNRYLKN